jgi:prepilin-type N-terminal cleavage/methylation domain-containing protein
MTICSLILEPPVVRGRNVKSENKNQRGFTLIEIAVVLMIMGLIVGAIFSFLTVKYEESYQQLTVTREQKIANSLAFFAQMHGYLPCPGKVKPSAGILVGNQDTLACVTAIQRNGIVPFRVLGLTQTDVTDGFGNPISYAVSTTAVNPTGATQIEAACRTTSSSWNAAGVNTNPTKAQFCCQKDATPLKVFLDPTAMTTANLAASTQISATGANFQAVNTAAGSPSTMSSVSYFAYVLVSHGKNGMGSFTFCDNPAAGSCTNTRKPFANAGLGEIENANDDDNFIATMRSSSGNNTNFDDIVLWRTQDRVISEVDNDNCVSPKPN